MLIGSLLDFDAKPIRHIKIELDLYDLELSPSEMEQILTRDLEQHMLFERDMKNIYVKVDKRWV